MSRTPIDYEFTKGVLKLMPLDSKNTSKRSQWISEYANNKTEWNDVFLKDIKFIELSGDGANGIVLKSIQESLNRKCAIKFWMPNKKAKNYNIVFEQYKEEVTKLANLNDPSITKVYVADQTTGGYSYSIMEWIEGETLHNWLKNNKNIFFNFRHVLFKQIIESIEKCHQIRLFHGDLHTKNILITDDDTGNNEYDLGVKILDFGTSLLTKENKPDYSKHRESVLLLETTLKVIHEEKHFNILEFRYYGLNGEISNKDDVRNYDPLIVSKTLRNLNEILYVIANDAWTINGLEDIGRCFVAAPYMNLDVIINIIQENAGKQSVRTFIEILYDQFYEQFYSRFNSNQINVNSFFLIELYYNLLEKITNPNMMNEFEPSLEIFNAGINELDYQIILSNMHIDISTWFDLAYTILTYSELIHFSSELQSVLFDQLLNKYEKNNKNVIDLMCDLIKLRDIFDISQNKWAEKFFTLLEDQD
ncbi:protein kinase domain-containing protein [Bacillus subtilis]|uniref:protein kinase domain-containing protein n=1 Tax=Bacillus subtilis TaxID=1423 RepID=UPI003F1567E6